MSFKSAKSSQFHWRKGLLEDASKKYNIQIHCINDEILLYIRYMTDTIQKRNDIHKDSKFWKEFSNELTNLYKDYRIKYAENPTIFAGHFSFPSVTAGTLFYTAYLITVYKNDYYKGFMLTQWDIKNMIHISENGCKYWEKIIKILRPELIGQINSNLNR